MIACFRFSYYHLDITMTCNEGAVIFVIYRSITPSIISKDNLTMNYQYYLYDY